jgi:CubicO group peptidase (beta-lactamase class C family)
MTSGVKWNEDYSDPASDVVRFYQTPVEPGVDATVSYLRKLPREAPPGQKWVYKTGETNLLGVLVAAATKKPLADYLSEKIWSAYGMETDAVWQLDRSGHEHGGSGLAATLRDFARFGQFILEGGVVDGRPVLPADWLPTATRKQEDTDEPGTGYGYQWWTRDDGTFFAVGIHGQMVSIDRPRRLVIALNSVWPVATGKSPCPTRRRAARDRRGSRPSSPPWRAAWPRECRGSAAAGGSSRRSRSRRRRCRRDRPQPPLRPRRATQRCA